MNNSIDTSVPANLYSKRKAKRRLFGKFLIAAAVLLIMFTLWPAAVKADYAKTAPISICTQALVLEEKAGISTSTKRCTEGYNALSAEEQQQVAALVEERATHLSSAAALQPTAACNMPCVLATNKKLMYDAAQAEKSITTLLLEGEN